MRIVSGKYKGKRILAPKALPVRPTTDMAKEALFNILHNRFYFDEISVLDLFSGIGSISLEFASRGCDKVVSVDQHPGCVKFLQKTSDSIEANLECIRSDAFVYLKNTGRKFDVIFADPPYDLDQTEFEKIIDLVTERGLLESEGLLILEHGAKMSFENNPTFVESRRYGGSAFSFFSSSASS
jgi:16S rRNA (guanine(966)-N(2))-methyltransferase RsmD